MLKKNKYFNENNELTEEGIKWMNRLNKYSEKNKRINQATCYVTDKEVADSIKNIKNNIDEDEFVM